MGKLSNAAFVTALFAVSGCGDSKPPASPPATGGGSTITGRERIGWTQTAGSGGDFALFDYALYVDGGRRVLEGDSCTATSVETTMECSAQLPSMTAGQHTLELAVFVVSGETVVESPRSPALQVTVAGLTAPVDELGANGGAIVSSDGITLRVDTVARELTEPMDVAAAPDGRLFIAERSGRIVVADGTAPGRAPGDNLFARALGESQAALTSLSLSPDFADTGLVHVTYVTQDRAGNVLRLARLRESGGTFGQAAVLASHPVPENAGALVRTGPDGALYIGIGTGADVDSAQRLADASGKILRLRPDGSIPDDNPWQSPVFSVGHRDPRGLAWHAATGALWEVEADDNADELNVVRAGANYGWPVANGVARHPRVMSPALLLPPGTESSGLTAVTAPSSPFNGDFIVSALAGEDLLRLRMDAAGRMQVAGLLLQRRFGRIRQVTAGGDGALFAITNNADTWGLGQDIAIRIQPLPPKTLTLRPARR